MTNKYALIINPNAGHSIGARDKDKILSAFAKFIDYDLFITESAGHAEKIAQECIGKGIRRIIVAGGDGTLNEVVNAIMSQTQCQSNEVSIGILPLGSGNDWCRIYSFPKDYEASARFHAGDSFKLQDAGKVTFHSDGKLQTRYFANVAGLGFDAEVANKTHEDKLNNKQGIILYLKNMFSQLLKSKIIDYEMKLDSETISREIFSMGIGIGKYNGGGMMQCPKSIADDGLFDITLIKDVRKIDVLLQVKNLYTGAFIKHPKVELLRCKKITVRSKKSVLMELDGEIKGSTPVEFEIIPLALRVIGNHTNDQG